MTFHEWLNAQETPPGLRGDVIREMRRDPAIEAATTWERVEAAVPEAFEAAARQLWKEYEKASASINEGAA